MIILLGIAAFFVPRLLIASVWLFSDFFSGVFETKIWPILGFIFLPLTLLWYTVVEKWYAGTWEWWHVVVLVIAVVLDMGSSGNAKNTRR